MKSNDCIHSNNENDNCVLFPVENCNHEGKGCYMSVELRDTILDNTSDVNIKRLRQRMSKLQGSLFKIIAGLESVKLMLIGSNAPCTAPCYPICCEDCPFGEQGTDVTEETE